MERISPYLFARDHWSLFVYIETRCVDYKETLNYDQLRINYSRHSMQKSSQRPLKDLWYSPSVMIDGKYVLILTKSMKILNRREVKLINYTVEYQYASEYKVQVN